MSDAAATRSSRGRRSARQERRAALPVRRSAVRRVRRRHPRLRARRQRRAPARPLVQVSPARGLLSAGPEEPNALVELRTGPRREPNTRATGVELYDGLEAASQNRWPSLRFDVNAVNGLFSSIFVAGFYYKTFMWPASFWEKVYEPLIRRSAGTRQAAARTGPRPVRQGLAALRRARDRRRTRRSRRGARGGARRRPRRDRGRGFRAGRSRAGRAADDRRQTCRRLGPRRRRGTAVDARRARHAAHDRVRRLRRDVRRGRARQRPRGRAAGTSNRGSVSGASSRDRPCSRPARSSGH